MILLAVVQRHLNLMLLKQFKTSRECDSMFRYIGLGSKQKGTE